jgi:hypothetical protein
MAKRPRKVETDDRDPQDIRRCVAVESHLRQLRLDPDYRWRRREIRREIDQWMASYAGAGLRTGLVGIPVVVHVACWP